MQAFPTAQLHPMTGTLGWRSVVGISHTVEADPFVVVLEFICLKEGNHGQASFEGKEETELEIVS